MIKNVIIIGAGQLGSRHLQALKSVTKSLNIIVVDPSKDSLLTAQNRYNEIPGNSHPISFLTSIPTDIKNYDVAIIASNSDVRAGIITSLLHVSRVEYLILEKIVFNKLSDFESINKLFEERKQKAYVNCSMRMYPGYKSLKKLFHNQIITVFVNGSSYGLACNCIHFIDLISYLSVENNFEIGTSLLDFPLIESKRQGFKEFTGTLTAIYENGSRGIFNCFPKGNLPISIEISSESAKASIQGSLLKAWISEASNGWVWNEIPFDIPKQSQLTAELVEDLLVTGKCDLVSYQDSIIQHKNLFRGIDFFLKKNGLELEAYPFT